MAPWEGDSLLASQRSCLSKGWSPSGITDFLNAKYLILQPLLGCGSSVYNSGIPDSLHSMWTRDPRLWLSWIHPRHSLRFQVPCESHVVWISFRIPITKPEILLQRVRKNPPSGADPHHYPAALHRQGWEHRERKEFTSELLAQVIVHLWKDCYSLIPAVLNQPALNFSFSLFLMVHACK